MTYDGFLFNDELDLLELRLMELNPVVDQFVLVEMGHNFMGEPKPLHYTESKARFAEWNHKIKAIVPAAYPVGAHPVMEHFQRREIARGWIEANAGDLLLIGDVDEIPNAMAVDALAREMRDHPTVMRQKLYYYTVNCAQAQAWYGTVALPGTHRESDLQKVRGSRHVFPVEKHGGWHFSWLGDEHAIANKLRSIDVTRDALMYGTPEIVKPDPENLSYLKNCREQGKDLFGREQQYAQKTFVGIEPGVLQPTMIRHWLAKHPQHAKEIQCTESAGQ